MKNIIYRIIFWLAVAYFCIECGIMMYGVYLFGF